MNVLAPQKNLVTIGKAQYATAELALIQRTVAKDASPDEFDQFLMMASRLRLDPLRRQIYCFIFNKDRPEKRQMVNVIAIDGFRTVAARSGDYRPDDRPARFKFDEAAKDPATNPTGLVSAEVTVYRHAHGAWFPITVEAFWDEFAPLKDNGQWVEGNNGKSYFKADGTKSLDTKKEGWVRMPRVMLAKCAEAQALRRGWPDDLSNVYEQSEIDQAQVLDLKPSEYAEQAAVEHRLERIQGANTILFDFLDDAGIAPVPIGKIADRIDGFLREHPTEAEYFAERNRHSLKEFWARSPSDALEVKKMLEKAIAEAPAQ